MSEYTVVWSACLAGLFLVAGSTFYSLGGRKGKWLRRFVGSFLISCGLWLPSLIMHNFYFWYLAVWPILIVGFSLGYGSDIVWIKIVKRTVYALAVLSAAALCAVVVGGNGYILLVFSAVVGLSSIILGVLNPVEAAAEEFFVCLVLCTGLVAFPFVVA